MGGPLAIRSAVHKRLTQGESKCRHVGLPSRVVVVGLLLQPKSSTPPQMMLNRALTRVHRDFVN